MPDKAPSDARVAILVDCDNTQPAVLEYALQVMPTFGRVVLRRGYGNPATLANRWQEALVKLAFTPCLQYQYASGKNTADIALALDAMEAMFDDRADCFCLVTSDSDFAHLCRKLRERGAVMCIVGEAKTPLALRNASDRFFEWTPPPVPAPATAAAPVVATPPGAKTKSRPRALIDAVTLLAGSTEDGRVLLSTLGDYLKRADPAFTSKAHGHSTLTEMARAYPELLVAESNGRHTVALKSGAKRSPAATKPKPPATA